MLLYSHRALGYKYDDGAVEKQGLFLKRMSGIMRLYTSIMVSVPPPKGHHSAGSPYGVEHAWTWLSRTMNMEPQPDITATMALDLLQVAGHALGKQYPRQFPKLLHVLVRDFLPKLKQVAPSGGPVSRLEIFLEKSVRSHGQITPPEGLLPANFWSSR
jgi:nucleoporin GLE1